MAAFEVIMYGRFWVIAKEPVNQYHFSRQEA
jgi:hypothetical protein